MGPETAIREQVPFLLEDKLKELGAKCKSVGAHPQAALSHGCMSHAVLLSVEKKVKACQYDACSLSEYGCGEEHTKYSSRDASWHTDWITQGKCLHQCCSTACACRRASGNPSW